MIILLMLNAHLMYLIHQYLSVKDIIMFYTSSINIIETSHQPLLKGLLLFEYPFLEWFAEYYSKNWKFVPGIQHIVWHNYHGIDEMICYEYNIFIYAILKAKKFDDIIAYLGTINIDNRKHITSYSWYINNYFNTDKEVNYIIFSSYDSFSTPYLYIKSQDRIFNFESEIGKLDIVDVHKTIKILTGKSIKWNYPDLLKCINSNKIHLIKLFAACKLVNNSYIHKSNCKSHQICEMINYQRICKN